LIAFLFAQQEEEEEVSGICPAESSERCAAQSTDTNFFGGESEGKALLWSPLSPEKLEEMMSEANRLAALMEGCELLEKENGSSETRLEMVPDFEPLPSIESLHAVRKDSRAPRRRTFNVSNSPLQALLPTVGPESCCSVSSPKAPPPLQTNRQGPWRETEKSSGKASSSEGSQVFLMGGTKEGHTQQAG
uniref:G2 and S phase-expressed protein 1 N-terminal domain-containing protein n=1 Tax=Podarcis muralis TaxID=64176 RepID=A0A670J399_PODMU